MPRQANYIRPIQLSLEVLRDAGIDSFPVSLKKILKQMRIRLMTYEDYCIYNACSLQQCFDQLGKDGATIELDGGYLIVYNSQQSVKERIRFTLAHELGHIAHRHHKELGTKVLRRIWVEKSLYDVMEDEANCFARNLLCPAAAVQYVLRLHGFTYAEYDEAQKRNVWRRVPDTAQISGLPQNLSDSFLIKQSFLVTDSAAKTRCHFLREDLRNTTSMHDTVLFLGSMQYSVKWRCRKCGAVRFQGYEHCYHCGAKNQFSLCMRKDPSPAPVSLRYEGMRFSSCAVCGNEEFPPDAVYCPICGSLLSNPCVPLRVKNREITNILGLAESGTVHLNPPGARYCLTCGAPTVYGESAEPIPLFDYLKELGADEIGGITPMKYGPNIPCDMAENGGYRVIKCPVCLYDENDRDADYCIMCGTSLTNLCDGEVSDYNDEFYRHSNPANARFCRLCGKPTAYSRLSILPPYKDVLRQRANEDSVRRELAEMDIDEDLFWEMQGESAPSDVKTETFQLVDDVDDTLPF